MSSDVTSKLRALAPTLAKMPRFLRDVPAVAAWTAIGALATGALSLFVATAIFAKDIMRLEAAVANLESMRTDLAFVKCQTIILSNDRANQIWVLQAEDNRRHGRPAPPPPSQLPQCAEAK